MHRVAPILDLLKLPTCIGRRLGSHHAAELDELVELMTSILSLATMRKTGRLPSLRNVTNETTSAVCVAPARSGALPAQLRFQGGFVKRMLGIWDARTKRDPEEASTFLRVTAHECSVGIASRDLLDAMTRADDAALVEAFAGSERVIGFVLASA
jgi:hypothetical protein